MNCAHQDNFFLYYVKIFPLPCPIIRNHSPVAETYRRKLFLRPLLQPPEINLKNHSEIWGRLSPARKFNLGSELWNENCFYILRAGQKPKIWL